MSYSIRANKAKQTMQKNMQQKRPVNYKNLNRKTVKQETLEKHMRVQLRSIKLQKKILKSSSEVCPKTAKTNRQNGQHSDIISTNLER